MPNKYIGLRDRHLNIFCTFGEKEHLENNITKAFINVLLTFDDDQLRVVCKELFNYTLPEGDLTPTFYLTKHLDEQMVKKYPNRIMFAFSPTGKSWGYEGLDIKDEEKIKVALEEAAIDKSEDKKEQQKFINETLEEIRKIREDKGSIPDAYLLVNINNKPELIVAMENKLHDLDPFQLWNHIEKSLYLIKDKNKPIYRTYENIVSLFNKLDTYMTNQFVEYLTILHYTKVNDFVIACNAEEAIRKQLTMDFGEEVLDLVHDGDKDKRNLDTFRCHVNYDYLHEINLQYFDDRMELHLSFGSRQSTAKKMLSRIEPFSIHDPRLSVLLTFHLIYQGLRIIKGSYVEDWKNGIEEYISYWKKNIEYVKTSTPQQVVQLYKKMLDDGKIDDGKYKEIENKLKNKTNKVIVVPEISLYYSWTYEEAGKLGLKGFANALKEKLNEALKLMRLVD